MKTNPRERESNLNKSLRRDFLRREGSLFQVCANCKCARMFSWSAGGCTRFAQDLHCMSLYECKCNAPPVQGCCCSCCGCCAKPSSSAACFTNTNTNTNTQIPFRRICIVIQQQLKAGEAAAKPNPPLLMQIWNKKKHIYKYKCKCKHSNK